MDRRIIAAFVVAYLSTVLESAEVCKDLDDPTQCKAWANLGECKKNPNYMLVKCKKSCGKCPTTSTTDNGDCKDLHDTTQCKTWAELGECKKSQDFMNVRCKKSCNKCSTTTTIPAKKPCYQPSWCFPDYKCGDGWTHELDKKCTGTGNVCCKPPAGKVYDCNSPNKCSYKTCWSGWSKVTDKTCPEPEKGFVCCKYSSTVTETGDCKDENDSCPGWAKLGECEKNPAYMHTKCKKSCNKCSGKVTPKPTTAKPANCKNTVDDDLCDEFAANGKCDMWSMKVKCRRSCNTCSFEAK